MSNTNIQHILIPVDFSSASESAVDYGAYVANQFSADILLLHAIEGAHTYPEGWFTGKSSVKEIQIRKKVSEKLNEYAKDIIKKNYPHPPLGGLTVKSLITTGKPVNRIAEIVEEREMDLIVMGTHGANGFEEFFVGHTAHKVVNLSPCPVITIREGFKPTGIKTIVLPIDETLHSRQKVNNVIAIASRCKSLIHILGIIQSHDETELAKLDIKLHTVEKAVKKAGLKWIRKVVNGNNIAVEAMKYAEEVNAELLAIMTDHESDMPGGFMGAFAHQVVNHSKVPVLSIKPAAGFVSYPT